MKSSIKVALVGTSCVGKTTLIEKYKGRNIPKLTIVEEVARRYFVKNSSIVDKFSVAVQGKIQRLVLRNEQKAHHCGATRIICDRSVLDAVAYVRSQGDIRGSKKLLDKVRFWLPTYTHLLLLNPADIPYQADSVRQEDERLRQKFHLAFLEVFKQADILYGLLSGTIEQRIKRIDQLLKLD